MDVFLIYWHFIGSLPRNLMPFPQYAIEFFSVFHYCFPGYLSVLSPFLFYGILLAFSPIFLWYFFRYLKVFPVIREVFFTVICRYFPPPSGLSVISIRFVDIKIRTKENCWLICISVYSLVTLTHGVMHWRQCVCSAQVFVIWRQCSQWRYDDVRYRNVETSYN